MAQNCRLWDFKDWKASIVVPAIGQGYESGKIGTALDYVVQAILARRVAVWGRGIRGARFGGRKGPLKTFQSA